MANDLLGGLGGLMKGLSGLMPQDDPNVQLMNIQNEVNELTEQQDALYAEIGKAAFQQHPEAFSAQADRLRLIQANLTDAQNRLTAQSAQMQAVAAAAKAAEAATTCPQCGHQNPEGVKFCQECGAKLGGSAKLVCPSCGSENDPGTKFCGACGTRLSD